jgi:hypothetical protein
MSGPINPNNFNSAAMRDAQVFEAPGSVSKKDVVGKKEASNFEGLLSGLQDKTETSAKQEKQGSGGVQDQVLLQGEEKQARGREELKGQYQRSAMKSQEEEAFKQNAQIATTQEKETGEKKKKKTEEEPEWKIGEKPVPSGGLGDSPKTAEVLSAGEADAGVHSIGLSPEQEKIGEIQVHLRKGSSSFSTRTVDPDFVRDQALEVLNPNAASAVSEVRQIQFPAAIGVHPNVDEPASAARILGPFNNPEEYYSFISAA